MVASIRDRAAIAVLGLGMLVIGWMTISTTDDWPPAWDAFTSPMHPLLVIAVGPSLMISLGWLLSMNGTSE
jgi:hypothetical protein